MITGEATTPAASTTVTGAPPLSPGLSRAPTMAGIAMAGALVAAVVLRFWTTSDLWLDEVLSVNIARLPLPSLFDALRQDGSPPLYYVLLHGWMEVFGTGDLAVRSLSGVFAVAALPVVWVLGRDVGGPRTAWAALVLVASSPFAVRYATEARMYSLLVLLTAIGAVATRRALTRPTRPALAAVAATSGLLLLTHYWAFYLVLIVVAWLGACSWRSADRGAQMSVLAAVAAGALLFLPWLPTMLFQLAHTGTPWGRPPTFVALVDTAVAFGGGDTVRGWSLTIVLTALIALGLLRRPQARPLAVAWLGTLALAIATSWLIGSAFAIRYTAVVLVPFLVLAAHGVGALANARGRAAVLVFAAATGLHGASLDIDRNRTQAGEIGRALAGAARPGDLVAYCPDQLGPAVSRLAPAGLVHLTYPGGASPTRVDWRDYGARNRAGDPGGFADQLVIEAGRDRAVWLVWMPGYRTLGDDCDQLNEELAAIRPGGRRVVTRNPERYGERADLWRYPAP